MSLAEVAARIRATMGPQPGIVDDETAFELDRLTAACVAAFEADPDFTLRARIEKQLGADWYCLEHRRHDPACPECVHLAKLVARRLRELLKEGA